jgi:hypothetical protein
MIDSLSYYSVQDKIFNDKIEAILHANEKKSDINWYFNDDVLNSVNWTHEPTTSLDEFYKLRAQQIRDKYDYVLIMYSGGADSHNVVWSFLNNGIKIDEIVASAPLSGLNNYQANDADISARNTISETEYAQIPGLKEIATKFPDVKITFNDYFEDMINYKSDEWLYKSSDWIHPTTVARYSLEKFKHIKDLAESGKNLGIIYGIDKPVLCYTVLNSIHLNISDLAVNVPRPAFNIDYPNVTNVLFYYTPDMPLMLVKQAHTVARWFYQEENINKQNLIVHQRFPLEWNKNRLRHSAYERTIIPVIYPGTHKKVFQSVKSTVMFLADMDDWFYDLHKNTRTHEMIVSDFNMFIKNIDKKYLQKNKEGFVAFTKSFKIGYTNDFIRKT